MFKKVQNNIGLAILAIILIFGAFGLTEVDLFVRLILGTAIGYVLTRGAFGFAGSVNKPCRVGSTRLARYMMYAFMVGALLVTIVLFSAGSIESYELNVNPINLGLVTGALMFGIGMTFSSCCASGLFTDAVITPINSLVVLFFFCMGVFIGYPLKKFSWVSDSIITSSDQVNGVFFPDLFSDFKGGLLISLFITIIIASICVIIAYKIERRLVKDGMQGYAPNEIIEEKEYTLYEKVFEKQFSYSTTVVYLSIFAVAIFAIFHKGWGVTSELGVWFGKFLMIFGLSPETLSAYSTIDADKLTTSFFQSGASLQNLGLFIGAILAVLLANKFKPNLNITLKQFVLCMLAGLLMGIGTRMSHGCNAGALFTSVIQFSLSGWLFLIFMVIGGVIGNKIIRRIA